MKNNITFKLSKSLVNNYILLVLVSYIYLIIKINNNSFKELLTYVISVLLFYFYFKNLKNSYIFGFLVILIRYIFNKIYSSIENFDDFKNKDDTNSEEIEKNKKDMNNQSAKTEEELTEEPMPQIDSGLKDDEMEEMKEDDTKQDNYVKSTKKGVNNSVDKAEIGPTI